VAVARRVAGGGVGSGRRGGGGGDEVRWHRGDATTAVVCDIIRFVVLLCTYASLFLVQQIVFSYRFFTMISCFLLELLLFVFLPSSHIRPESCFFHPSLG
jgi:hypothetical protein